jgi:hypothetical protein
VLLTAPAASINPPGCDTITKNIGVFQQEDQSKNIRSD